MLTKEQIREDLYKIIKNHYELGDYTEALRDAMFFVKDLLQEKSGLTNMDNTRLIESSLLGKNAAIKINKYESESEINFQEGVGYALKGLAMHLRNPISHDRIEYSEQDADAQLLYINYLVNQIDKSSGRQLITDWLRYLQSDTFTSSKVFAQELIKELPKKQQYDLLISIWRNRTSFAQNRINNFVDELVEKLSNQEKASFISIMNTELINCTGDYALSMMFHIFAKHFYVNLKRIVKIHIEDIIKQGIENGSIENTKIGGTFSACSTFASKYIESFITKEDIKKVIRNSFFNCESRSLFIQEYFSEYVDLSNEEVFNLLKNGIKLKLSKGEEYIYNYVIEYKKYDLYYNWEWEDSKIYKEFSSELEKCKQIIQQRNDRKPVIEDELPF